MWVIVIVSRVRSYVHILLIDCMWKYSSGVEDMYIVPLQMVQSQGGAAKNG